MIFEPRAADLDPVDVEDALLRAAVGDCADEAAVLLLIDFGHWLPQLQSAGPLPVGLRVAQARRAVRSRYSQSRTVDPLPRSYRVASAARSRSSAATRSGSSATLR